LRNAFITLVTRYYEPFKIDVQTAAARNLMDVSNSLAANAADPTGEFDAYVFVAGVTNITPGGTPIPAGLGGIAPAPDVIAGRNTRDDSVVVFANNLLAPGVNRDSTADTALAYTAAHEAGHAFGLTHSDNATAGSDNDL